MNTTSALRADSAVKANPLHAVHNTRDIYIKHREMTNPKEPHTRPPSHTRSHLYNLDISIQRSEKWWANKDALHQANMTT